MIYHIDNYRDKTMGLYKRIATEMQMSKSLVGFSKKDRAAARVIIRTQTDVRRLTMKYFGPKVEAETEIALLKVHDEGNGPQNSGQFLVFDRTTGRPFMIFFDDGNVVYGGRSMSLKAFNKPAYRWFRVPKLSQVDLEAL